MLEFLGLPMVSNAIGGKKVEMNISGTTVEDALHEFIKHYGEKAKEVLLDSEGNFDPTIQIALNGESFIPPDKLDTVLKEGDRLVFMLLLAGG